MGGIGPLMCWKRPGGGGAPGTPAGVKAFTYRRVKDDFRDAGGSGVSGPLSNRGCCQIGAVSGLRSC